MKLLYRLLFLLAVILVLPISVQAAGDNSITVLHSREDVGQADVVFTLYAVDNTQTNPLEAYATVVQAGQKPAATAVTDARGKAVFTGLADGKYLLTGGSYSIHDEICDLDMSLVQLPAGNGIDSPPDKVVVVPKYSMRPNTEMTLYRVVIIWEDAASTQWRPESVSVQLFRNGEAHSIVQLSKDGNWQYSWTDTDPLALWAVLETVPEKYKASYSREGNTFVITNTLQVTSGTDSGSKLPQTGQVWWPVPVLTITGCTLLLLGWLRRKEYMDEA